MIRVLIADSCPIVRHGLMRILDATNDFCIVDRFAPSHTLLQDIHSSRCQVLIVEVVLSDSSTLNLISDLHHAQFCPPILVLGICSEKEFGVRVLKAGASGYLMLASPPEEVIEAVRRRQTAPPQLIRSGIPSDVSARCRQDANRNCTDLGIGQDHNRHLPHANFGEAPFEEQCRDCALCGGASVDQLIPCIVFVACRTKNDKKITLCSTNGSLFVRHTSTVKSGILNS